MWWISTIWNLNIKDKVLPQTVLASSAVFVYTNVKDYNPNSCLSLHLHDKNAKRKTQNAKRMCRSDTLPRGGAPRSESIIPMLAGGKHTATNRGDRVAVGEEWRYLQYGRKSVRL